MSGTPLTVSATSASLTDAASADSQVLGRVGQGSRLTATGRKSGDWIEVQAPSEVSGWVYGELVRDGVIAASSVKVRSGPGIGYVSLGTLMKGTPVVPRGRQGDWLEIAGQPLFVVWVERAMVAERAVADLTESSDAVPPSAPEPVVLPVETPPAGEEAVSPSVSVPPSVSPSVSVPPSVSRPVSRPVFVPPPVSRPVVLPNEGRTLPVRPVSPVVSPALARGERSGSVPVRPAASAPRESSGRRTSPVGRRLIATAPQGEPVMVSGVLRPVGLSLFPAADYRLISVGGRGPAQTLCYVTGPAPLFQGRMGQSVTVEGRKYWSVGSREPIVLVYSVH